MTISKFITPEDLIVVDNFYRDAAAVRKIALSLPYVHVPTYNVAASQSIEAFASKGLVERFEKILGRRIYFDQEDAAFGKFRMMSKDATARLHIHNDRHAWAGIIYLTPDEHSRGGTGWFWHKETGFSGPPSPHEIEASASVASQEEFERILVRDSLDLERWEMFHFVPFKFNRVVLFRGSKHYHGTVKRFGESFQDGRLTQNFFFRTDSD